MEQQYPWPKRTNSPGSIQILLSHPYWSWEMSSSYRLTGNVPGYQKYTLEKHSRRVQSRHTYSCLQDIYPHIIIRHLSWRSQTRKFHRSVCLHCTVSAIWDVSHLFGTGSKYLLRYLKRFQMISWKCWIWHWVQDSTSAQSKLSPEGLPECVSGMYRACWCSAFELKMSSRW